MAEQHGKALVPQIRFAGFTDPWEQRKLGEVADNIDTGRSVFCSESYGRYPVLGSTSVIGSDSSYDYEGAFLLTARVGANAGNLYRFAGKVKISDNTVFLQAPNSDFLFYLLSHFDLRKLSFGTGQPLVRASELRAVEIDVPKSENEQKSIAEFFDRLDSLITLHQRKYDKLCVLKKSMLDKMFPEGGSLYPEIRFAGFTDPWEQRKLGELYQKNDERNTDGLGSERTLSVASMTFNSTGNGADESSLPSYKRLRLGDIAFEGHANKEFAYGRFVLNDAGNGIMSPRFTCLRPIAEQEYSFWKYFIHSEEVMRPILVNSTKSGTMMNELVVKDFLEQEILVPSLPEQRRIGAFFDRLDSLITLHQRKLELLRNIKKSMLDKMFV